MVYENIEFENRNVSSVHFREGATLNNLPLPFIDRLAYTVLDASSIATTLDKESEQPDFVNWSEYGGIHIESFANFNHLMYLPEDVILNTDDSRFNFLEILGGFRLCWMCSSLFRD